MKLDFSHVNISKGLEQIPQAIKVLIDTPNFIKKHQLWKGFLDHSWVLLFSIVIASAFTYTLYRDIHDYFIPGESRDIEINISTDGLDKDIEEMDKDIEKMEMGIEEMEKGIEKMEKALEHIPEEGKAELEAGKQSLENQKEKIKGKHKPLFSGSLKFLLLIFLEVLIYHFAVKTNNILKKTNKILAFKEFSTAQIRMIKVMGRKWIAGLLMYIIISIACGITGTAYLKDTIMFLVYGYYMGFAFLDNYLEQFHFSIKKSATCIQSHFGAATVFGLFTSLVMNVPLIGPLVVPFLCAIAATRYGHQSQMEDFEEIVI